MKGSATITRDGKVYANEAIYKRNYNYSGKELSESIENGLPYVTQKYRGGSVRFFNLEDCHKWHRGEPA